MIKSLFCLLIGSMLIACNGKEHVYVPEKENKAVGDEENNKRDSSYQHILIIINDNSYEIYT